MPEQLFEEKMTSLKKQMSALEKDIAHASENGGNTDKIDAEQLIKNATQKIGDLAFEQKKFIIERVVDKIIASPQEITIWGHIPAPALTLPGKVNHVPQHRHGEVLTQLPFEIKTTMPATDKGKRGYSDQYIAQAKADLSAAPSS